MMILQQGGQQIAGAIINKREVREILVSFYHGFIAGSQSRASRGAIVILHILFATTTLPIIGRGSSPSQSSQ